MKRDLGDGYELDDDRARLDREAVHAYLGGESYWAEGRTRARQDELIDASDHVVGLYKDGAQVGFARAVDCDAAGFVYLADVYVLDAHRGRGLGVELVREIVENGPYAGPPLGAAHARRARALREARLRPERAADGTRALAARAVKFEKLSVPRSQTGVGGSIGASTVPSPIVRRSVYAFGSHGPSVCSLAAGHVRREARVGRRRVARLQVDAHRRRRARAGRA